MPTLYIVRQIIIFICIIIVWIFTKQNESIKSANDYFWFDFVLWMIDEAFDEFIPLWSIQIVEIKDFEKVQSWSTIKIVFYFDEIKYVGFIKLA